MNKLKILAAAIALFVFAGLQAQDGGFYSEIRIFMEQNRADYDKIVESFFSDEKLSLDDYTLLYYGYTFTDAYKPDYINSSIDSLIGLKKYEEAYTVLKAEHKQDPTSLQTLFDLMNLADVLEKPEESSIYQKRYVNIVKAILQAGGDGSDAENAIKVNRTTDEFQLLSNYFQATSIVSKEFSPEYIDKISIKTAGNKLKDVYFDFTRYMAVAGRN